ncbi:MAG: hypothetical protein AAFR75_02680 [Pseudomonadota bacterium]
MKTFVYLAFVGVTLVWLIAVYSFAIESWPAFSLDLSPVDAGTRAAYDQAVAWHVATYAAAAAIPPLVAFGLMRALLGLGGRK